MLWWSEYPIMSNILHIFFCPRNLTISATLCISIKTVTYMLQMHQRNWWGCNLQVLHTYIPKVSKYVLQFQPWIFFIAFPLRVQNGVKLSEEKWITTREANCFLHEPVFHSPMNVGAGDQHWSYHNYEVFDVGSDTFGNPIFQKVLQN